MTMAARAIAAERAWPPLACGPGAAALARGDAALLRASAEGARDADVPPAGSHPGGIARVRAHRGDAGASRR
jgi:hypothetical protein